MATKLRMPQLGESVVEGTVGKWLKTEGDSVEKYEPLLEVVTDKVDSEITSPDSGLVLKIYVEEGETVQAGRLLACIGEQNEPFPTPGSPEAMAIVPPHSVRPEQDRASAKMSKPPRTANLPYRTAKLPYRTAKLPYGTADLTSAEPTRVSPVVARIAAEHNVDLSEVTGTGRGGRVSKKDILSYLETRDDKQGDLQALTPMRRAIAEHMVRSVRTSPHASTVFEIDASRIVAHRATHKDDYAQQGIKLTFTPYFVLAAAAALQTVPAVNSAFTDHGIQLKREINIGVAVAIDEGLIVPVIKNADQKSLLEAARKVNDLAWRSRAKELRPEEVSGGTFTITNHGVSGSLVAVPIIYQPQAAILGVGTIEKRVVVVENDAIAVRPMAYLSLTFDHRVLDGAVADSFMQMLKQTLERWS